MSGTAMEQRITAEFRDTSGGHVLRVTLDDHSVDLDVECHEPDGAACRLRCDDNECEGDCNPPCMLKPVDYCMAEEWISGTDASDACASAAKVPLRDGMLIDVNWNGDAYEWRPIAITAETGT